MIVSSTPSVKHRLFVSPIGIPKRPQAIVYAAAERPRRLITPNRYVRQIIGVGIRLPNLQLGERTLHPVLSITWAKPARWDK